MTSTEREQLSKQLAYSLRHDRAFVSASGWASFNSVLAVLEQKAKRFVGAPELHSIVAEDAKGRYEIGGERIRAVQGHSFEVDLGLVAIKPPAILYHGTVDRFVESILVEGLRPKTRNFVHLSEQVATAEQVAARRSGEIVILTVSTEAASESGVEFFQSSNGVWLAKAIPAEFIMF